MAFNYQSAHDDAESFSEDARRLLAQACPTPEDRPLCSRLMAEAKAKRMTWVEGLRYVVQQRRGIDLSSDG